MCCALVLTSLGLMKFQGGYGAGHGELDAVVFLLSLPWSLIALAVPHLWISDIFVFVVFPFLCNSAVCGVIQLRNRE